jgi:predicted membrane protein (TIGR00267 family)
VIGPVDGILTALTLAAGRILTPDQPIDISLALRIALAASLSGGFVFFVAEYARLRGELVHAARHLNLASTGRLATSHLGQEVLRESVLGTVIAAATGFGGALLPLILGAAFSTISWMTIAIAIAVLASWLCCFTCGPRQSDLLGNRFDGHRRPPQRRRRIAARDLERPRFP